MTRRVTPSSPPAPQLAVRVLAFFASNPDESLTREDVAEKFGVHIKTVPIALKPLLHDGALQTSGAGLRGSPVTYSAGPGLLEGAIGTAMGNPIAAASAHMAPIRITLIVHNAGTADQRVEVLA